MKTLTIKNEYLEMIRHREKVLEIRVGYPNILSIKKGDSILFLSGAKKQIVTVRNVRRYTTFDEMISHEDYRRIINGLTENEVLWVLRQIYPPEKESLGVVVIEVQPIES